MTDGIGLTQEMTKAERSKNPTIEKWQKHYQEKSKESSEKAGILFKNLDVSALRSEISLYASTCCNTKKGSVSIDMLIAEIERTMAESLHVDVEDKESRKMYEARIKKLWKRVKKHPYYPFWHALREVETAVRLMDAMPEEQLGAVI